MQSASRSGVPCLAIFVRENGSVAEGLGIGLTLMRNLVSQHGGHITASSDGPGRGSIFTIELPLVAGPAMAAAPSEMAIDRSIATEVGLIHDDIITKCPGD